MKPKATNTSDDVRENVNPDTGPSDYLSLTPLEIRKNRYI